MSEDITKLPRWAQDRIKALEADVAHAQAQLAAHDAPDGTPITWTTSIDSTRHGLHKYATVRFQTPNGYVDVHLTDEGELRVYAQNTMVIRPRSANLVYLENCK